MKLYIAEKPSVAKAIVAELGTKAHKKTYVETKSGDLVSWCFGHLMELDEPDEYLGADVPDAKKGKVWREQDLPIFPQRWRLHVKDDKGAKAQFKVLGALLKKCDQVVNCGDPDREGQLLIDEVLEHYGNKKPVLRYWASAQDPQSVRKGLKALKPNAQYKGLLLAAKGRQRADWLLGYNLTRAFTLAARRGGAKELLSVGRVQTPTLNLVAQRDLAIKNFKPIPFFTIKGLFGPEEGFSATFKPDDDLKGLDSEKRLVDAKVAKEIYEKAASCKSAVVLQAEHKQSKVEPPVGLSLSDMQQLASSKWGFSAQKTLDICQALYEKHKLTSYPRTDCPYLPEVQHSDAKQVLAALKAVNPQLGKLIDAADPTIKSKIWNDKKITAHHGLVPTSYQGDLSALGEDEKKIYDVIARRYIAQFYPPCLMGKSTIILDVNGLKFEAKGSVILKFGFKAALGATEGEDNDKKEDDQKVPLVKIGDKVTCKRVTIKQDKTKPPQAFTEGSLIRAMENIHSVVEDPTYKKYLREGDGIGTSATRAAIIDELKKKGFLISAGKKLNCTPLGFKLLSALPDMVKNPILTALFEAKLKEIEGGKLSLESFEKDQQTFVKKQVEAAKGMQIKL